MPRAVRTARVAVISWNPAHVNHFHRMTKVLRLVDALRHPPGLAAPAFLRWSMHFGTVAKYPTSSAPPILVEVGIGPIVGNLERAFRAGFGSFHAFW